MHVWTFTIYSLLFLSACSQQDANAVVTEHHVIRDTSITPINAFTDLRLDTLDVEQYLQQHDLPADKAQKIRMFYGNRNYQHAWFTEEGLSEHAQAFWSQHQQFIDGTRDSSAYNKHLHQQMNTWLEEDDFTPTTEDITLTELQLTEHFFDFAHTAYAGKVNPEDMQWHIPRKKVNALALLDSLVRSGSNLQELAPVNYQYTALKKSLKHFQQLAQTGNWEPLAGEQKIYKKGDSSSFVGALKKRLHLLGDLETPDTSPNYDERMTAAVIRFQQRHGLEPDGIAGPAVLRTINTTPQERIEQLLINMERMRWLPAQWPEKRIVANIPAYEVAVYEGNSKALSMDIVVGKAANRTVIFSDQLKYVVFSPYWNLPRSIVRNEIIPAMRADNNYLARKNMEITGNSNGLPVIRQKPGPGNALGKVKFLFPNKYSIYFHDTPAKSLFSQNQRAFSHGCIRLHKPFEMATYVLKDQPEWTDSKIIEAMNLRTEKWVTLKNPIPVFIIYQTAWVDADGTVQFRDDIYGHDKKMAKHLFQ